MSTVHKQLINKNIHRTIFELSLPGMVSSVLQTLYQLIDAFWVGKLGPEALAAIGGCSFILWAVFSLTALSVNGTATLVAQHIGAGNPFNGKFSAGQGLLLNTLSAIILSVVVFLLQGKLYLAMGFAPDVLQMASQYMTIILSGLIFQFWFMALEGVFRGLGDTKTPMYILAIALTINALLDPVFIFGWFGLPAMGIGGAALATIIAHIFAALLCLYFLNRKKFIPTTFLDGRFSIRFDILKRILEIGAPIGLSGFFFSLIYVFLTNIISRFGTEAIAAIGVCHRIEGIAWFACVGFSVAASTLVGQYVGARRFKEAEKAAWWVTGYGAITLFAVALIFFIFPNQLMRIFTTDPLVRKLGVEYLRIIAAFEIFLAIEIIIEGAFSGAGYTLPVMLVTVPVTAARIPLAWYLALELDMGTTGIWWAIAATTFLKGLFNLVLFASGLWKKKLHLAAKF